MSGTPARPWLAMPTHRAWLERGFADIIAFALGSIRPDGGFTWQAADGSPMPGRAPSLLLTARMTYTGAIGVLYGTPGAGELLDHGMASLLGLHADPTHGGWLTVPRTVTRKSTYDHVHVGLAAAAAVTVGHPDAATLLDQATTVIDAHLWDADTQTLRESFAPDWSDEEHYRGANANMHGLEAFLAIGRTTADAVWHERGLAIASRLIDDAARHHGWLLPEHYTGDWQVLLTYNRDQPAHPFRPYGATLGHSLEWARFLVELHQSPLLAHRPSWLLEAAGQLARRALIDSWALDGRPGLVYTVDWDGRPVSDVRLHWPVCEGIQATAALHLLTGDPSWENWYRRLWDHAARYFIDAKGTWRNELDEEMREAGEIWPGRPDVYHCSGALTGPLDLWRARERQVSKSLPVAPTWGNSGGLPPPDARFF